MSCLLPPIDTWERWSAAFNDVRLWQPLVDAICAREGIAFQRIEAPESSTNAVFILDRRVVIKIYSPFWTEFPFERGLMELLARDGKVPVPAIRAAGVIRDRTDWSWMPLWLGLCNRDAGVMRAILQAYDPALLEDGRLSRRIAAWTLLHDFGSDAIAELFDRSGEPCPVTSLAALQALVWPGIWPADQAGGGREP